MKKATIGQEAKADISRFNDALQSNVSRSVAIGKDHKASGRNLNWMICTDHDHLKPTGFEDCCRERYSHLEYDMALQLVMNRIFSVFMTLSEKDLEREARRILGKEAS